MPTKVYTHTHTHTHTYTLHHCRFMTFLFKQELVTDISMLTFHIVRMKPAVNRNEVYEYISDVT
jgi:hypothetical protein